MEHKAVKLNATNVQKVLKWTTPGLHGAIDFKNISIELVVVHPVELFDVTIPLNIPSFGSTFDPDWIDYIIKDVKRVFGCRETHKHGLVCLASGQVAVEISHCISRKEGR